MIWYEIGSLKFDHAALLDTFAQMSAKLGKPETPYVNFGGWSIQSDNGDWRRGFEQNNYFHQVGGSVVDGIEFAKSPHDYWMRPEACMGEFERIRDTLDERGLHPHRARISRMPPGTKLQWHADNPPNSYFIRIHVPIITNPECAYEILDPPDFEKGQKKSLHMVADGGSYFIDATTLHRAKNLGDSPRYHFMAEVWDTQGVTENYQIDHCGKNLANYGRMIVAKLKREESGQG